MFLQTYVKARVPYAGDRLPVSLLERTRVLIFHWTAEGSGSVGRTLFVLKCTLDGTQSSGQGEAAAERDRGLKRVPLCSRRRHPTLTGGLGVTKRQAAARWPPEGAVSGPWAWGHCPGQCATVPSENSGSFLAPGMIPSQPWRC